MGTSNWSNDFYADREAERKKAGTDAFAYDRAIRSGKAVRATHKLMNPSGVTRESRDSDVHPESVAIAIFLDVTGSMATTPHGMQKALPTLMTDLVKAGVAHPQVLFGAIGDYFSDDAPLQVGQFEAGIETDDDLGRIFMEGGGGGSNHESYQNALYFAARHTSIDCFEKRGTKGWLFMIGDEHPYAVATKDEIKKVFGDTVQGDIPIQDLLREAQEKYNVYFIIPAAANHGRDPGLLKAWQGLLGANNVLVLNDVSQVCSAITGVIANNGDHTKTARASKSRTTRL